MQYPTRRRARTPGIFIGFALCLYGGLSAAADRTGIYGALPDIRMLAISPDGATLAWRNTKEASDTIIIYSIEQQEVVGGVALEPEINPSNLVFATNDKLVLVVSEHGRVGGFRGKFDVSSAWVYSLEKRKMKPLLVPGGIVYAGQSGLGDIVGVSADSRYIYMPAFSGDADVVKEPGYSLFRVDLDQPHKRKVHHAGTRRSKDYLVDADGNPLVHEFFDKSGHRHVIAARDGKDWKEIYSLDTALPEIGIIGLTPDHESLVVSSYDDTTRRHSYYRMSLDDGEFTGTLFARPDADIDGVISDINRVVHGVRYAGFIPSYDFLDESVEKRLDELTALVEGNSVWLVDWTEDWRTLVILVEGPGFSGQYFALSEGKEPEMLGNARKGFDDATIHPVGQYSYTAADGLMIPTLLTIPRGSIDNIKNLPAVMLPHGGPAAHDSIGFDWFAQGLADQGYLVIQPQFRGSTGFGIDHRLAGNGEWGRKMQSDLTDAVTSLAKRGYIDPDRVCIVGMSYGGYAALAGGAFTPDVYRCVVSINGVTDLNRMIDHNEYWVRDNESSMAYFETALGGGQLDRKYLRSVSPAQHAEAFRVPVLLLHGEDDEIVSVDQSKRMYSRLKKAGKDVTFIELENGGHGLQLNENRARTMRETVNFVNRHLAVAN